MNYRTLGRSGLRVSPLCLGTMLFGGRTDEATARSMVARARDASVNFIDTADVYTDGKSEEIVGRAIAKERHHWVLATKLANKIGDGPNRQGLSRKWILEEVDHSLKRLGTDYVDILYLHKEDHQTPLDETVSALGQVIRQGKVRYFGISNHRAWRLAEIVRICDATGVDRPVISQPYYNAFNRMPEVEHLPACNHYGLGVFPYSPVARGVLTGKYEPGKPPQEGTRAATNDVRLRQTEWREESLVLAQKVKAHAEKRGMSATQFAVLWVLNNRFITGVVAGPRTQEQLDDYIGVFQHRFTKDDEALIDGMVVAGHSTTPGYNDPAYPIEGRPVHV
ncbi:MAG: aldo/keto reductase [Alphaproteobacteria bacterium]|nr:aldo/keto reductase [Alphaproteobacteria bacterium]